MPKNAYIHIPFCTKKCNYCSFVSFEKLTLKSIYIDALLKEIKANYQGEMLDTLYFGGGTPSTLSLGDFEQILNLLNFNFDTEVTVEINPNGVNKDYLAGLLRLGVNRLSIGVQVFDDEILRLIGRSHKTKDAVDVVKTAQNAGFDNISVDLIYGLPTQSPENFKQSLEIASGLGVDHISLYGLKIEEGCNFYNNRPDFVPDDDSQADMYLLANEFLALQGFERYEISNFARRNKVSRHNLNYWDNNSYYGFGTAAHGYSGGVRYENSRDIEKYIQNPIEPVVKTELSPKEKLEEEIFLGFRRSKGIDTTIIERFYNIDFEKEYKSVLEKYLATKHLIKTPSGYKLSDAGVLVSNVILSEFI